MFVRVVGMDGSTRSSADLCNTKTKKVNNVSGRSDSSHNEKIASKPPMLTHRMRDKLLTFPLLKNYERNALGQLLTDLECSKDPADRQKFDSIREQLVIHKNMRNKKGSKAIELREAISGDVLQVLHDKEDQSASGMLLWAASITGLGIALLSYEQYLQKTLCS